MNDRGQAFTFALFIGFLVIVGVLMVMLNPVVTNVQDEASDINENNEYHNYTEKMSERRDTAWNSLPALSVILGGVFVLAMAVLRSGR